LICHKTTKLASGIAGLIALIFFAQGLFARQEEKMNGIQREEAVGMLRDARDAVKKYYYDPQFHGIDLEARYREFDQRIKAAPDFNEGLRMVAAFLSGLHDSHTYFVPPPRPYLWDYGFRIQLIGNTGFISRLRPDTDAASKLQRGDQILGFNTYAVNRADFHDLWYTFDALMPQVRVQLDVRDPDGKIRRVVVDSKFRGGKNVLDFTSGNDIFDYERREENEDHVVRQRYVETGDIMIWQMPEFLLENDEVDHFFDIARKKKTLILDLRGNPGGAVETLEAMVGNVMDHDVTIATPIGRKKMKPLIAKTVGHAFSGKLIVLVDSQSASAAELFARVVQIEHRGIVMGDVTSGSVMEAREYPYQQGLDTVVPYAFSITAADLIMRDGKSLEHVGVTPDQEIIPTAQDLEAGRDPVLAQAVASAGDQMSPADAGKLFPFEWVPF
jgi:C-terminal processing protease CtpA/Prc